MSIPTPAASQINQDFLGRLDMLVSDRTTPTSRYPRDPRDRRCYGSSNPAPKARVVAIRRCGHATLSASARYTVARLTPSVEAIVLADSPLACIRCARATFDGSSALGRPMDCPRAFRASRAAARRSRPSSNSNSAKLASTPATIRPVAFDVSMPSRRERSTIPRSPSSRMVAMTSAAFRPKRSMPTTTMASPSRA